MIELGKLQKIAAAAVFLPGLFMYYTHTTAITTTATTTILLFHRAVLRCGQVRDDGRC